MALPRAGLSASYSLFTLVRNKRFGGILDPIFLVKVYHGRLDVGVSGHALNFLNWSSTANRVADGRVPQTVRGLVVSPYAGVFVIVLDDFPNGGQTQAATQRPVR